MKNPPFTLKKSNILCLYVQEKMIILKHKDSGIDATMVVPYCAKYKFLISDKNYENCFNCKLGKVILPKNFKKLKEGK